MSTKQSQDGNSHKLLQDKRGLRLCYSVASGLRERNLSRVEAQKPSILSLKALQLLYGMQEGVWCGSEVATGD